MSYKVGGSCSSGRVTPDHDSRKTHTKNVDTNLTKDNVCLLDELHDMSIEEYINQLMQPVIDEYNKTQRRKDRRVEVPYTEYHANLKNTMGKGPLVRELVFQYGEHDTLGGEYYSDKTTQERKDDLRKEFVGFYQEALEDFQRKYPHLKVLYAYIHFDEPNGTPHMHMAFTYVGEGYKQKLKKQISLSRALENDGIERSGVRDDKEGYQLTRLYRQIRDRFINPTLRRMGYELKEEVKGRTHTTPAQFYELKDNAEQEAKEIVSNAKEEAGEIVDEAKGKAKGIVKNANEMSEIITGTAKSNAKAVYDEMNEKITSYNQTVVPKIQEGVAYLSELEEKIVDVNSDPLLQLRLQIKTMEDTVRKTNPELLPLIHSQWDEVKARGEAMIQKISNGKNHNRNPVRKPNIGK